MKVITRPFMQTGGVAQFVNTLEPFFDKDTVSFKRGKRRASGSLGFLLPFFDIFRFFWKMLRSKPNLAIVNSSLSNVGILRDGAFVMISRLMGCKTVLYIHGFKEEALRNRFLLKMGYFKSDKIFVLSEKFKILLEECGFVGQIEVSYNPVEQNLLNSPIRELSNLKDRDKVKIVMMSRIEESKGIFIGLQIMRDLVDQNIELHVAGTGTDLEKAKAFVKEYEMSNVKFHGFVTGSEKLCLLQDSDLLLFPPLAPEGLPINILESLSLGLYVISRPEGGIVDLKKNYYMLISDSKNHVDFRKIIDTIITSNPNKKQILENQHKARIDFSPMEIFKKLVS